MRLVIGWCMVDVHCTTIGMDEMGRRTVRERIVVEVVVVEFLLLNGGVEVDRTHDPHESPVLGYEEVLGRLAGLVCGIAGEKEILGLVGSL
jgi:hypothetical protein